MLALQLLAAFFLFLAAALFFGPQLVIYGPRALPEIARNPQVRMAGGCLASLCILAIMAPHMGSALINGGETVTVLAVNFATLSFSLI